MPTAEATYQELLIHTPGNVPSMINSIATTYLASSTILDTIL